MTRLAPESSPLEAQCFAPLALSELQEDEKEHPVNGALKSTPVIASALTAFIMTAPTGSQAKPADDLQILPARHELAFSQAAAEAIKTKTENANVRMAVQRYIQSIARPDWKTQYIEVWSEVRNPSPIS
jgi:hypothetical protein